PGSSARASRRQRSGGLVRSSRSFRFPLGVEELSYLFRAPFVPSVGRVRGSAKRAICRPFAQVAPATQSRRVTNCEGSCATSSHPSAKSITHRSDAGGPSDAVGVDVLGGLARLVGGRSFL